MSENPKRLSPEAPLELIVLRDKARKELYSANDPQEIRRLRQLIEHLEIKIRLADPLSDLP